MRYNTEIAKELIALLKLRPQIILNWRFKGKIPDKYLYASLRKNIITQEETLQLQRLSEILNAGLINIPALCQFYNLDLLDLRDYLAGNRAFYREDFLVLKNAMVCIREEFQAVADILEQKEVQEFSRGKIRSLLGRNEINWEALFKQDNFIAEKWEVGKNDFHRTTFYDQPAFKSRLQYFLNETRF